MHRYFLAYILLSYLTYIDARMQRIFLSIPLLFGAYLAAVDELSIVTFKPKIFSYFAGSARKRRQIIFTKILDPAILPSQRAHYNTFPIIIFVLYQHIILATNT